MSRLLLPLDWLWPEPTPFWWTNCVALVVCLAILGRCAWVNVWCAARPAFMVAALLCLFYQVPLLLFANLLERWLETAWWMAASVHLSTLALLAWVWMTPGLTVAAGIRCQPAMTPLQQAVPPLALVALLTIFFSQVPLECTALHALLRDPNLTLLAREFCLKLLGSSPATYAFGWVANAAAPACAAVCVHLAFRAAATGNAIRVLAAIAASLFLLAVLLLGGAKGLLVPAILTAMIAGAIWAKSWTGRFAVVVGTTVFVAGTLSVFELARERSPRAGHHYDFAAYAARLGVVAEAEELLASLKHRDYSLGLPVPLVEQIENRLFQIAHQGISADQADPVDFDFSAPRPEIKIRRVKAPPVPEPPAPEPPANDDTTIVPDAAPSPARIPERVIEYDDTEEPPAPPRVPQWHDPLTQSRPFMLGSAMVYRVVVLPFQVGAWHHLYAEECGRVGWRGVSWARLFQSDPVNMAEEVYHRYGVVYSSGDRTSTSTAPTSFLIAYPACLGWIGLATGLVLLVLFDAGASFLLVRMPRATKAVGVGLLAVIATNFMVSDFSTVLFSHGAAFGLVLMGAFVLIADDVDAKRLFDATVAALGLILLSPLLLAISCAVWLKMGCPIFFRQERPGLGGHVFHIIKFRTMRNGPGADGERLTPFGQWLRSTSLDELPELWNVLRGEMSLVGPRPLLPEYLPLYTPRQARRHDVRPGITGWAQVNGRNHLSWEEKLALDVWYVDHRSFLLDLKILALTITQVFSREGVSAKNHPTMEKFTGGKE